MTIKTKRTTRDGALHARTMAIHALTHPCGITRLRRSANSSGWQGSETSRSKMTRGCRIILLVISRGSRKCKRRKTPRVAGVLPTRGSLRRSHLKIRHGDDTSHAIA